MPVSVDDDSMRRTLEPDPKSMHRHVPLVSVLVADLLIEARNPKRPADDLGCLKERLLERSEGSNLKRE